MFRYLFLFCYTFGSIVLIISPKSSCIFSHKFVGDEVDSEPSDPDNSNDVGVPKSKSGKPKKPKKGKKPKLGDKMTGDDDVPFGDDPVEAGAPGDDLENGPGLKDKKQPRKKGKKPGKGRKKPKLPVELGGDGGDPSDPNQDDEDVSSHACFHYPTCTHITMFATDHTSLNSDTLIHITGLSFNSTHHITELS